MLKNSRFTVSHILFGMTATMLPASVIARSIVSSEVLKPSDGWRVDYGINECRLIRKFGDATHSTTFQLSRVDPNPDFAPALAIASEKLKPSENPVQIFISVDGHAERLKLGGSVLRVVSDAPPIMYTSGAGTFSDVIQANIAAKQETTITVTVGNTIIGLALGNLEKPLHALDGCVDDLVRTFGYDPEAQRAIKARAMPVTSTGTWFNTTDYPVALSYTSKSGGVMAWLDISDRGGITGCHVMEAGGDPAFEQLTCEVAKKNGRFTPALDKTGKPIATYFVLRVMWRAAS